MENVEPIQRHLAHAPPAQQREFRVRARRDQLHAVERQERRTGALDPQPGVARAMFEPTVIAQIASWSHGSR